MLFWKRSETLARRNLCALLFPSRPCPKPSSITFNVGAPTFSIDTPRRTSVHRAPVADNPAGSHRGSPGRNSHPGNPPDSPAQLACIAAPTLPLSLAQSIDCKPEHDHVLRHAPHRGPSPQIPHGIHGPPRSRVRRLPTNTPPGKPPRSAALPIALRPAHPPGRHFACRDPKRSKEIASAHHRTRRGPAARSVAPQIPHGIHGPPRSRADRIPMKLLHRRVPRCAAGSGPRLHAYPLRSNAVRHRPTNSGQSIRSHDCSPAAHTPPGSKPGNRDPPKSRHRRIPMNIPAGKVTRSSAFPAPHLHAYSPGSSSAAHHLKSRELVCLRLDLPDSPLWRTGKSERRTQPPFSGFACGSPYSWTTWAVSANLLSVPTNLNLFLDMGSRKYNCPIRALFAVPGKGSTASESPIIFLWEIPG